MSRAIDLWREKLEFLQAEEALASGAQKFALRKGIEEARAKIRELGGDPGAAADADAPTPGPGPTPAGPARPAMGEKRREIFISYAWGDDSPMGRTRAEVVEKLYAALEKDGFAPIRDRDQIRPGELISDFIRRLTRADLVVAVISDKYLHSPYCMQEIYRLWQRSQTDPAELARCVVPIILPDAKIGHLRDRAAYLRHWKEEAHEHDRLYEELRDQLSPETVQEIRLVREFAGHVDGILKFLGDVLMPRQLEAHLDDGFPAVLEALRRRLGTGAA